MKLPRLPFATTTTAGIVEWLRLLVTGITVGWGVEHAADGTHNWHETDLAYNAGAFSAESSTWTVDSSDMKAYRSARLGPMMMLAFRVETSDVGAGNQSLRVALPTGYRISGYSHGALNYSDAGAATAVGLVVATPNNRFVSLYTGTVANWTATTGDNTLVQGTILMTVTKD